MLSLIELKDLQSPDMQSDRDVENVDVTASRRLSFVLWAFLLDPLPGSLGAVRQGWPPKTFEQIQDRKTLSVLWHRFWW